MVAAKSLPCNAACSSQSFFLCSSIKQNLLLPLFPGLGRVLTGKLTPCTVPVQQKRFTPHTLQERLSPVAIIPLSIIHRAAALQIAPAWFLSSVPTEGAAASNHVSSDIASALSHAEHVIHTANESCSPGSFSF